MKPSTQIAGRAGIALLAVTSVQAQQTAYGQCGGENWTGPTTCVSGWTCTFYNDWYSQCVPASTTLSTTTTSLPPTSSVQSSTSTSVTTTSASSKPTTPSGNKLKWFGVDESCAEFGTAMPGTWGKDYTFANTETIGVRIDNPSCLQTSNPG